MTVDPEQLARALFINVCPLASFDAAASWDSGKAARPPWIAYARNRHSRDGMGGRMTSAAWLCLGFTIGARTSRHRGMGGKTMSAADCRAGVCSCGADDAKLTDADRTVTQALQVGRIYTDGSISWMPGGFVSQVSPVMAEHTENVSSATEIQRTHEWLIYHEPFDGPDFISRIKWARR